MKTVPRVLAIGEILWDIFLAGRQLGGASANVAYHATYLGADVRLISRVGRDTGGDELRSELSRLGVNTDGIQVDEQHTTGTVTVTTDRNGQPDYTIHENVAYDYIVATPDIEALARTADAFYFGTLAQRAPVSRATIQELADIVPLAALRFFDANLRQSFYTQETLRASLKLANILKLNHEELPIILQALGIPGDADEETAIARIAEKYELRLVALTRGGDGSILWTPEQVSHHRGVPVNRIADTVGAGDSFSAAILVGLLYGYDLEAIHDTASRLAAYVCTQTGGTPPFPLEQIQPFKQ